MGLALFGIPTIAVLSVYSLVTGYSRRHRRRSLVTSLSLHCPGLSTWRELARKTLVLTPLSRNSVGNYEVVLWLSCENSPFFSQLSRHFWDGWKKNPPFATFINNSLIVAK